MVVPTVMNYRITLRLYRDVSVRDANLDMLLPKHSQLPAAVTAGQAKGHTPSK